MTKQRNVAVFIFDDVEVLDFAGPFEVFNVAGEVIEPAPFNTYTVAMSAEPIKARGRLSINPHFTVDNCPQPDILLVPGGIGTRPVLKNSAVLNWLKAQSQQVELLLSVCTGALVLGQAGLLAKLPATTHHTAFDLLQEISPTTTIVDDQRFVDTGQIITSGGITAGIDMSLYVTKKFLSEAQVALIIKEMEYQWHW
jgi:transcriptional regulator GlxA family with amidase domain